MARLVPFSEAANLAIHALAYLGAQKQDRLFSAAELASAMGVSEAHLSKVLRQLTRANFLSATRGAKGGFKLRRDPDQVTLLQIVELIDGPPTKANCLLRNPICARNHCLLNGMLESIHQLVIDHLSNTRLSHFRPAPAIKKKPK